VKSLHRGKSDPELSKLYSYYRRKFFDNKLPPPSSIYIGYDKLENNDSATVWDEEVDFSSKSHLLEENEEFVILLNIRMKEDNDKTNLRLSLIHEMAHIKLWPYIAHGNPWKQELLRLFNVGAYYPLL
jgi:hypothetical protein